MNRIVNMANLLVELKDKSISFFLSVLFTLIMAHRDNNMPDLLSQMSKVIGLAKDMPKEH